MSEHMTNSPAGIRLYPCDRGMGGVGVGYHEFTRSGGVIFCRYCGRGPQWQISNEVAR